MDIESLAYINRYGKEWQSEYDANNRILTFNDMQVKWSKMADTGQSAIYLTRRQMRDYMNLLGVQRDVYYDADLDIVSPHYMGVPVRFRK